MILFILQYILLSNRSILNILLNNMKHLLIILQFGNFVNNDYEQDSKVSYTFALNKQFSQLIEIESATSLRSMIFNSDFAYIEVWFINQKIKLLK